MQRRRLSFFTSKKAFGSNRRMRLSSISKPPRSLLNPTPGGEVSTPGGDVTAEELAAIEALEKKAQPTKKHRRSSDNENIGFKIRPSNLQLCISC